MILSCQLSHQAKQWKQHIVINTASVKKNIHPTREKHRQQLLNSRWIYKTDKQVTFWYASRGPSLTTWKRADLNPTVTAQLTSYGLLTSLESLRKQRLEWYSFCPWLVFPMWLFFHPHPQALRGMQVIWSWCFLNYPRWCGHFMLIGLGSDTFEHWKEHTQPFWSLKTKYNVHIEAFSFFDITASSIFIKCTLEAGWNLKQNNQNPRWTCFWMSIIIIECGSSP